MRRRISQPRSGLVAAVALMLLVLVPPAARAAAWVGATPPSSTADGPSGAVVAVDPAGDAVAAWTDEGGGAQSLLAAWRPAGGPWQAPQPLAGRTGVDAPAVTVDAAGNVTIVWIDSPDGSTFAAHAARRDAASGTWSAPHDFPPAADGSALAQTQVRADALGNVVAAWLEYDAVRGVTLARAAVWSGGAWSAPATLSDPDDAGVLDTGPPQIAPDATGGALVAWTAQRLDSPFDHTIQTRAHLGGGTWGGVGTLLPDVGEAVSPVRLAGLDDGDAAATWFQDGGPSLFGAYSQSGGRWNVDALSGDFVGVCGPVLALGPDVGGGATVAWKAASTAGLETMRLTRGGPEPDMTAFASATESAEDAAIDRGTLLLVAHDAGTGTESVLATRRGSGGWSAPALVAQGAAGADVAGLKLARDAAGDQLASWIATDALGARSVAAAAFQVAPPQLTDVQVPANGTAGSTVALSASARSTLATIAQTSWDFGDGTPPASGAGVQHAYAQPGAYTVTVTAADTAGNVTQATRQIAIAPAPPATQPPAAGPPPPGDRATLAHPAVVARNGVVALARGARTLRLTLRNPNGRALRGRATLSRPRSGRRPALALASRRGIVLAGRQRTTVALKLTDQALRALKRAPGHRLRVTLALRLRAADGRRVTARAPLTLDASARFGGRARPPLARTAC